MVRWFIDRSPQRGIPSVSLRRLLPDARFLGCDDLLVSGCAADSRRLDPGQVFVALRGPRRDGHEDIPQALDRGAVAVVVEEPRPEAGSLQVVVPDTRRALAKLCQDARRRSVSTVTDRRRDRSERQDDDKPLSPAQFSKPTAAAMV